jgi:hypothetical protein
MKIGTGVLVYTQYQRHRQAGNKRVLGTHISGITHDRTDDSHDSIETYRDPIPSPSMGRGKNLSISYY